jgi:hypothetical protein
MDQPMEESVGELFKKQCKGSYNHISNVYHYHSSHVSSVNTTGRPGSIPGKGRNSIFSSPPRLEIGSGTHVTFCHMDTEGSLPGIKRPGREANRSPPTSAGL